MVLLKILLVAACVAQASLLPAQTIQVWDDSSSGSPAPLKGTVTFDDKNPDHITCSVTGHNNSTQSIIAYAAELDLAKPSGEPAILRFQHDRFFKELPISPPQSDFPVLTDCETGHEDIPRTPAPPEAHAKLLFVQYADGSKWGDEKTTAEVMSQRADVLAYLHSLKAAYSTGGLDALAQALSKDQPIRDNDHNLRFMVRSEQQGLREMRDRAGLQAVVKTIDEDLATAELRKAALLKP